MPDANAIENHYKTLTDQELLNFGREGGFTDEAERVFRDELARRNLTHGDVKRYRAESEHLKLCEEVIEKGGHSWGPGLLFFGRRYLNEADKEARIEVRTKWFSAGGIPLIPIASYRFQCKHNLGNWNLSNPERSVLDRVPLNWPQVFITWIKTWSLIIGLGLLIVGLGEIVHRVKH